LDPVDNLRSTGQVGIGLREDFKGENQFPGSGVDSDVGPLIFVQMKANIESAGHLREAINNVHAAIDAIGIYSAIDIAGAIAIIGIDDRAIGYRRASSVAIGGVGHIAAKLRAIVEARPDIDRSAIGIVCRRDILEDESEISKVGVHTVQVLEGIVSHVAAYTAGDRERLHILLRDRAGTR
jgi:hypothetical protein